MRLKLFAPQQAHAELTKLWPQIKAALQNGHKLELEIKREGKSRDQEEMYHAIIGHISKQASHLGAKWDAEDWKRFLVWQFAKEVGINTGKLVPSLDGTGIVQLGMQTRKFTKDQASQFTEWLLAWAAQNGVEIPEA